MILCNESTCRFNDGSGCSKKIVHIEIESGSMEQGKHRVYNACQDYEGKEDAGTD